MIESVLIIDDEADLRNLLTKLLRLEDYTIYEAENGKNAITILNQEEIAVVIVDVKLPDVNGIDLISKIKELNPLCEIILLTAYGTIEDGVRAIKAGAFDYITKGDEDNKIIPLVIKALEKYHLKKRIEILEKNVTEKYNFSTIFGKSEKIKNALSVARKVSDTDTPVLLLGETGTGKELFANSIHYAGKRKNNAFVAINCSAIAKDILESEMFGYKAGAFTGAVKNKKGLFEEAHLGTLFLDEIGELDLSLQAKFLRVLETNSFIKPGDTKPTQVDVRIIAATNRKLEEEVKNGNFRADLYYRISVMKIEIPSLRERKQDIKEFTEYFIEYYSKKLSREIGNVTPEFIQKLEWYDFPGNIRELRNIIERVVILSDGKTVSPSLLPKEVLQKTVATAPVSLALEEIEKNHILSVLKQTDGNKTKAAELLGIGLTTLYRKLGSYGIE
jgi:two-component system, NtrC family, response regulator